jgi:energy-coupling factor transporter ATP-binding protein EcfA2
MGNTTGAPVSEKDLTAVVCVGVTGAGKSTLCNTLARLQRTAVSAGFKSGTKHPCHFDVLQASTPLRMVDTVGFLSNQVAEESSYMWWLLFGNSDAAGADKEKCEQLTPVSTFGIDVFLFIERYGRFTEETAQHFRAFTDLVGPEALKHTILVFTHVTNDRLTMALQEEELPADLLDVTKQVHSTIGVECVNAPRQAVRVLLQEIQRITEANNKERYMSDLLTKIQEKRKDLDQRIEKLKRPDRREQLRKQRQELNSGLRTYAELLYAIEDAEIAERLQQNSGCFGGCFSGLF